MENLGEKVIAVSARYLGPGARRFLERQCKYLDGVTLESLSSADLGDLSWWVEASGKLVMSEEKAAELSKKISSLALGN